jgi:hypothetical protein
MFTCRYFVWQLVLSLRRKTGPLSCHSSIMISPMRYQVTFKECNILHLHRFLVWCFWISQIPDIFHLGEEYPPLLYGAENMHSTHILDYFFSSALVLSIYPWVMNLYVRRANGLFQPLKLDPCIPAVILVKFVLQRISNILTDTFLIL